jgi:hypothetical protein
VLTAITGCEVWVPWECCVLSFKPSAAAMCPCCFQTILIRPQLSQLYLLQSCLFFVGVQLGTVCVSCTPPAVSYCVSLCIICQPANQPQAQLEVSVAVCGPLKSVCFWLLCIGIVSPLLCIWGVYALCSTMLSGVPRPRPSHNDFMRAPAAALWSC